MYDDLHPAHASVDWAVAQLPSLRKRLNDWLTNNVYTAIREQPSNVSNNVLVTIEKEPLPLAFQVEAGAYINAIRSSLDILALFWLTATASRSSTRLTFQLPVVRSSFVTESRREKD
jgi:hypothetical protein